VRILGSNPTVIIRTGAVSTNLAMMPSVERERNKSSGFPLTTDIVRVMPKTAKAGNTANSIFEDRSTSQHRLTQPFALPKVLLIVSSNGSRT
jgi:hypothetical protein